ncbi:protoheme IX farnesyltransferase [Archaeoglobales archaeon]|nr:MAG: protoheme IX farnesyltransferase [Archaeoglobales archaeon]
MDIKSFYEVIKPKQTMLLMVTFVVAYLVAAKSINLIHFIQAFTATILTVAGTTALNMWLDRDIDALMPRTKRRPVPSGRLTPEGCAIYGLLLFALGILVGLNIGLQFVVVLSLGLFFDIIVYTVLLKRKSPYSIVLGGLAGAMPSLAGWVAVNGIGLPGIVISTIVLLWIPSHIWYLSIHFEEDYRKAGIPMLPLIVGMEKASWAIVVSVALMLILVTVLFVILPLGFAYLALSVFVTSYFLYKAIKFAKSPSRLKARKMYKLASMTLGIIYFSMLIGSFF